MDHLGNRHFEIRTADAGDAQAMIAVKHASVFKIGAENYPPEQLVQRAGHLDQSHIKLLETRVAQSKMLFWVATIQKVVMGYAALNLESGEVGGPYVRPEHGREGIGSGLVQAVEAEAPQHSVHTLFAESPQNVVAFFTQHNGFDSVRASSKALFSGGSLPTTRVEKAVSSQTSSD